MKKISQIINSLESESNKDILKNIYGEHTIDFQKIRFKKLLKDYLTSWGDRPVSLFTSPGTLELAGNQIDHNGGTILISSINKDIIAIAEKQDENVIELRTGINKSLTVSLKDLWLVEREKGTIKGLIRGICSHFLKSKYKIGGLKISFESQLESFPSLGRNESIAMLISTMFNALFNEDSIDIQTLASFSQDSIELYYGEKSRLARSLACGLGNLQALDFHNGNSPITTPLDLDMDQSRYKLVYIESPKDSKNKQVMEESDLIEIEMKEAASICGKKICRSTTEVDLLSLMKEVRETKGDRVFIRAIHFFRENIRVKKMIHTLLANETDQLMELLKDSSESSIKYVQNLFSVKNTKEQENTVFMALSDGFLGGKGFTKIQGNGFNRGLLVFVPKELNEDFIMFMNSIFENHLIENVELSSKSVGLVLLT